MNVTQPLTNLPTYDMNALFVFSCHAETILIDDDENEEEEKLCMRDFAVLQGAASGDGDANTETKASRTNPGSEEGKAQTKVGNLFCFCNIHVE